MVGVLGGLRSTGRVWWYEPFNRMSRVAVHSTYLREIPVRVVGVICVVVNSIGGNSNIGDSNS